MQTPETTREARLRRELHRAGYALGKSRRADWTAGTYRIIDRFTNALIWDVAQSGYGLSLDDVEEWLND